MKTTFFISPALLIAGLLLSGCDGLDDPGNNNTYYSDFEGTYQFFTDTEFGTCTIPTGSAGITMRVSSEGDVTSDSKINRETGETMKLSGRVRSSGSIDGDFNYSFHGHTGTFDGVITTEECDDPDENGLIEHVSGVGDWVDYQSGKSDCDGSWFVCIVNHRIRN